MSEEVQELLQSSHQLCVHNLSMTVHLDESFIKTNGVYRTEFTQSLERNVCFNQEDFMGNILDSKHLKEPSI